MKVGQIKPLKVCQSIKNSVEKHLGDNMNIRMCFMYLKFNSSGLRPSVTGSLDVCVNDMDTIGLIFIASIKELPIIYSNEEEFKIM